MLQLVTTGHETQRRAAAQLALTVLLLIAGCNGGGGGGQSISIRGTVSGLVGSGLVLRDNNRDDLAVSHDGSFAFATRLARRQGYAVTVSQQPSMPAQTCSVSHGVGMTGSDAITEIAV